MTEMEQLKQNADDALKQQRITALNDYLDVLSKRIDECLKKDRDSWYVFLLCWLMWMAMSFVPVLKPLEPIGLLFYFGGWAYTGWHGRNLSRAFGEFRGAIKVLEILGFIQPHDHDGDRKRRRVWSEGADIVKGWFTSKKKAQDAAYAPA
jgi:hypothetical protein